MTTSDAALPASGHLPPQRDMGHGDNSLYNHERFLPRCLESVSQQDSDWIKLSMIDED